MHVDNNIILTDRSTIIIIIPVYFGDPLQLGFDVESFQGLTVLSIYLSVMRDLANIHEMDT